MKRMTTETLIALAVTVALVLLYGAYRIFIGPRDTDRIVGPSTHEEWSEWEEERKKWLAYFDGNVK